VTEALLRPARLEEAARLQAIEVLAAQLFRAVGMDAVADDEPLSIATLEDYVAAGRAFVAADEDDEAFAYCLLDVVDEAAYVAQLSLDPAFAGRKIGRSLLELAEQWARSRGLQRLTLTTFAEVPWNGPYYERCGFRVLSPAEVTSGLAVLREKEAAHGLDEWPRVCMAKAL
jgi:GNAT superfamily N-acetyltransferase